MWKKLTRRLADPLFYRKRLRQILRPLRPPRAARSVSLGELTARGGPWLLAVAHPDDELFASGLLCELSAAGVEFHIVCLTRGEGGMNGGCCAPEKLGETRERELRASAAVLGAASVRFLGHVDPPGGEFRTYAPVVSPERLAEQIAGIIREIGPEVVVTHGSGGEYWHPAHVLMHEAVRAASKGTRHLLTLHAWQAEHPLPELLNRDDPADLVIEGAGHRERRLAAFRAHRTQRDYFASRGGGSLEGFADRTSREAYRHYPPS